MLHSPDDSHLTPDQRRHEVASILARGILRLRTLVRIERDSADSPTGDALEPPQSSLDMPATSRPHVTGG